MKLSKKGIITTLLFIVPILSFSQKKVKITGEIKNYPFDALFVRGDIPKSQAFFDDTIQVSNGRFQYETEIEGAVHYTFVVKNMLGKFVVYASNETIDIEVDYHKINQPIVKGSKANGDYNFILEKYYDSINDKATFLSSIVNDDELKNNMAVPYFVYNQIDFTNYDFAETILKKFSKAQRKGVYSQYMFTRLKQARNNVIGAKAYDFDLYDLNRKRYRLSDLKGNYVLLEFSASWCGWCKKEISFLKEVYEYGKDKGLVVITINLDTQRELWEKDSTVPWMTLSDLKAFESATTKGYDVGGIPQIYVIDKTGKIISRDLRGKDLVQYIKKIL